MAPTFSHGFKSGEFPGHSVVSKKSMPSDFSICCVAEALKHGALSWRKVTCDGSITFSSSLRKGRTLSLRMERKYSPFQDCPFSLMTHMSFLEVKQRKRPTHSGWATMSRICSFSSISCRDVAQMRSFWRLGRRQVQMKNLSLLRHLWLLQKRLPLFGRSNAFPHSPTSSVMNDIGLMDFRYKRIWILLKVHAARIWITNQ